MKPLPKSVIRELSKSNLSKTVKPIKEGKMREPLAESILVPKDSQGRRAWSKMTDDQIVEYVQMYMEENEVAK